MTLNSALKATLITSIASLITLVPNGKPIQTDVSGHKALIPVTLTQPLKADLSTQSYIVAKELPKPPPAPPPQPKQAYDGTNDENLNWIISHESGGNPYAMNSIGACGLGQSLPCSKVLGKCGSLDNVACQIEWVREYCVGRYGSTANAKSFWEVNRWY